MLFPLCSRRSVRFTAAAVASAVAVIGVVAAPGAGADPPTSPFFATDVRIECHRGVDATGIVTLTRDSTPIALTGVVCTDGVETSGHLVTAQEPNDWEWEGIVFENGVEHPCADSGTHFPAHHSCGPGLATVFLTKPKPGL